MQIRSFLIVAMVFGAAPVMAQTSHVGHTEGMDHAMHSGHMAATEPTLTEPGQGAFAAIAEVVKVLEADPETDWTRVDLAALRAHLVDMDRLVTGTQVEETVLPDGIRSFATGDADTIAALLRMVPAHAAELAKDPRWSVRATERENGVELEVTSTDPATVARIQGLGFFGLMASQDHHRAHHLMIARGQNAHAH
ncbi:hypothetical protein HJ526_16360 [Donghicola sp. C2-DW-16]|uniref:DinB family protein n=1 Tax=Donghicola mangrovi TaxID=2729614 RepID=A0ABX2PHM9_9RHOB|nr:hypothetical protein [Donghicola mangrovi]NVO29006.1 hypothetical protein [Donghicola mangrovi]